MRRRSISPNVYNLVSPIEIPQTPIEHYELKTTAVNRILKWNANMCRNDINKDYVDEIAARPASDVWTIKDRNGTVFGFALTEQETRYVKLHLICSVKRKGEGLDLFRAILQYCRNIGKEMRLEPINRLLARKYMDVAHEMNFSVFYEDLEIDSIPPHFENEDELRIVDQ